MFVYSKTIIRFVAEIKTTIKNILTAEVRLKCMGEYFYNRYQTKSYPISVVIYNNKAMLGYFDSHFQELGFHESLMHCSREQLHNIIRHELAHYLTFIKYGYTVLPHAVEFKDLCRQMGWDEKVHNATTSLDLGQMAADTPEDSVLRKIKKLMALSASSHKNEAEQAMIKSQQLLLKHNLESKYIGSEDDEKIFMHRVIKQKKETAKMRAIAAILKTFFVSIVYNRADGFTYLEILGTAVNIEIAGYVASALDTELENLWDQAQRQALLKGSVAKTSFFLGLFKGYCDKIQALKKEYPNDTLNALVVLEKKLTNAQAMVYPRLSSKRNSFSYCQESAALGEKMGRQLNINPAVGKPSKASEARLSYSKP